VSKDKIGNHLFRHFYYNDLVHLIHRRQVLEPLIHVGHEYIAVYTNKTLQQQQQQEQSILILEAGGWKLRRSSNHRHPSSP
jgi:hypothetical protein